MGSAMWYFALSVLVSASSAMILDGTENIDEIFEPLVAFKCGFASKYLTTTGWQVDHSQSCLSNADDIMAYCDLKYPDLQITNVIPSPSEIEANWTVLNGSSTEKFIVRPYRCIVGEFDSDPLVVPDGCSYGTSLSSNSTQCASYFQWNSTAHERCASEQSELFSFGVVRPCSVGTFYHMEYVCCPASSGNANPVVEPSKPQPAAKSTRPQMQRSTAQPAVSTTSWDYEIDYVYPDYQANDWYEVSAEPDMSDDDEYEDAYQYDAYLNEEGEPYDQEFEDDLQYEEEEAEEVDDYDVYENLDSTDVYDDTDYDPTKNYFQIYMKTPKQLGATENEIYVKALRFVKRYYDSQKQLLLQQLAEADFRVSESENSTAYQLVLAADIDTIRDLYEKTDKLWNNLKKSMQEEHYNRVAKNLQREREIKSEAWQHVARQLKRNTTSVNDLTQLLDALKNYLNAEEKERNFWINHYVTLLSSDADAAAKVRQLVKTSLRAVEQRLKSIMEFLKREGFTYELIISVQVFLEDQLLNFSDLDSEVQSLFPDLDSATESSATDEVVSVTDDEGVKNDFNNADDEDALKAQLSDEERYPQVSQEKPVMLIVMVSAGSFVLVLVCVTGVALICTLRRRQNVQRNSNLRARRHAASLHHALFLVPGATKHGSLEPLHLDSDARRIVVDMPPSPRQSVYAQTTHSGDRRIRGHDNPMNNFAGIVFSDSAPLVEHDVLNEDSKHVA